MPTSAHAPQWMLVGGCPLVLLFVLSDPFEKQAEGWNRSCVLGKGDVQVAGQAGQGGHLQRVASCCQPLRDVLAPLGLPSLTFRERTRRKAGHCENSHLGRAATGAHVWPSDNIDTW